MQKQDFETCQKRFRDFEILPKFSETHVFQGTIHHPFIYLVFNSFLCHVFHSSHSSCRFLVALDVLLVVRTFLTFGC